MSLAPVAVAGLLLVAPAAPAAAAVDVSERITEMKVDFALRIDGTMHVTETIAYDFGKAADRHGIERFIPVKFSYDAERNRVYPLSNESASSPTGAPSAVDKTSGDVTSLRIGDPDRTVSGVQTYVLEYDLAGVVNTVDGGQELYWNALGDQTAVPVEKATVTVTGPGAAVQRATCFEGGQRISEPCAWSVSGGTATFAARRALAPHEGLTVVAGFPAGTFPGAAPILREKWKIGKAFAVNAGTGAGSLGVVALLAGGTGLLVARRGRDRRYLGLVPGLAPGLGEAERTGRVGWRKPVVAVRFTPPERLRVGELGTLVDEHANVEDVTATIIDLAVRGYLRIEEAGVSGGEDVGPADGGSDEDDEDDEFGEDDEDDDWDEETKAIHARLRAELEEQIAKREAKERAKAERRAARARRWGRTPAPVPTPLPGTSGGGEPRPKGPDDWVLVRTDKRTDDLREYEADLYGAIFAGRGRVALSELRETFSADLRRTQTMLYAEVTERGWFAANPRSVRARWRGMGSAVLGFGVLATVVLAIWTHLALVGVALIVAGVIILVLAGRMPARTASGTALLAQVQGFRLYLETAEADQIRFEEGQDVFSRYLPYAIVFGVAERWADLFARIAASGRAVPAPDWYSGYGYAWGPGGFDYHRFGSSMDDFSDRTSSSIAASPPASPSASGSSGFSGGFSGGGGGGGGVGSW